MYACMTPVGFDTSDKFENHCSTPYHCCLATVKFLYLYFLYASRDSQKRYSGFVDNDFSRF